MRYKPLEVLLSELALNATHASYWEEKFSAQLPLEEGFYRFAHKFTTDYTLIMNCMIMTTLPLW
jgi:hypothetical protein